MRLHKPTGRALLIRKLLLCWLSLAFISSSTALCFNIFSGTENSRATISINNNQAYAYITGYNY